MIANARKSKRWIAANQAEIAELFDVSVNTIAQWRSKGMPGKPGRYDIHEIIRWWKDIGPGRLSGPGRLVVAQDPIGPEDELLLSGADSPALERFRLARAKLAEIELEVKRKSLVPREAIRSTLSRFAVVLRQFGERLGKRYGPEAIASFNDALADGRRAVRDEFGDAELLGHDQ